MMSTTTTREDWLQRAISALRPLFTRVNTPIPKSLHVSVGFPSNRALSSKHQAIGQCWGGESSSDKRHHIFISPVVSKPVKVLEVLVHECVHAAVGLTEKHRGRFKRIAVELGLRGKMTSTHAGGELTAELEVIAKMLGKYPHGALDPAMRPVKKQPTRLLKAVASECCGYLVRVTLKWLDEEGEPLCPHGEKMRVTGWEGGEDEDDA